MEILRFGEPCVVCAVLNCQRYGAKSRAKVAANWVRPLSPSSSTPGHFQSYRSVQGAIFAIIVHTYNPKVQALTAWQPVCDSTSPQRIVTLLPGVQRQ